MAWFARILKVRSFFVLCAIVALSFAQVFAAGAEVQRIQIGNPAINSQVPEASAQGRFLAPQAVSTVDISADGKFITVGTMAFSHDANVWQFAPDGASWRSDISRRGRRCKPSLFRAGEPWRWDWLTRA